MRAACCQKAARLKLELFLSLSISTYSLMRCSMDYEAAAFQVYFKPILLLPQQISG